jgi:hypothetical protein
MARVLLLTTALPYSPSHPEGNRDCARLSESASIDRFGIHEIVSDISDADLVLFVYSGRPDLKDITAHSLYREHADKACVFHIGDRLIPFVPGVFTSLERRYHFQGRTFAGFYPRAWELADLPWTPDGGARRYLYSFVGRLDTHRCRQALARLDHPRGLVLGTEAGAPSRETFVRCLVDSQFVLCPRGYGASSLRLFEALQMGRVPVIMSDQWVPPTGPQWDTFSLRIPESRASLIPALLEAQEPFAARMGALARRAWEEWFAPDVGFHRVVEWCLAIKAAGWLPDRPVARVYLQCQRIRPAVSRRLWRGATGRVRV